MAEWSVVKTTSTPGPLTGGANVAYTVTATNTTTDTEPVLFEDRLSLALVGATWTVALSGGATWTDNPLALTPIAGQLAGPMGAQAVFTITGTLDSRYAQETLVNRASANEKRDIVKSTVTKWWTPQEWGLTPMTPTGSIGCEPGLTYLARRGGLGRRAIPFRDDAKIVRSRNKSAEFTGVIPWQCCDSEIAEVTHWAFEVQVYRPEMGGFSFVGPVVSARHTAGGIEIVAKGMSAWWSKRALLEPLGASWLTGGDAILELHRQAMLPDPSPAFNVAVVGGPTGLSTADDLWPSEGWYIADAVGKVDYNTSWFDFGRRVIVTPRYTGPPLRLDQEHLMGDLGLVLDGAGVATAYQLYGASGSGVQAQAVADPALVAYYGVLTYVTRSDTITQQDTANRVVVERLENRLPSEKLASPENIQLSPRAPVTLAELWPGRLVLVTGEVGCRSLNRIMRLDTVEEWVHGVVKVSMSTIPITQQAAVLE